MLIPPDLKDRVAALERSAPNVPPALHHLFALLPRAGEPFPVGDRIVFLRAIAATADVIYGQAEIRIQSNADQN